MNKIKQQFSELRKTTPKHVQWLALIAAFIVVLILLTLLVGGGHDDKTKIDVDDGVAPKLIVEPDNIDWIDTKIGETQKAEVVIHATAPVIVKEVRLHKDVEGFKITGSTCGKITVTQSVACKITMEYVPTSETAATPVPVFIDWYSTNGSPDVTTAEKITVSLSAVMPEMPKPVAKEPAKKPEPVTVKEEIKQEIEVLAPVDPFDFDDIDIEPEPIQEPVIEPIVEPAPIAKPTPVVTTPTNFELPPEKCSDFAFPGYNANGTQIGWIKPEKGAYYFHPFSDKDCDKPTGIYNPDNGIITDINDTSKKIGTDAEHMGYTTISGGVIPQLSNPAVPTSKEPEWSSSGMTVNGTAISGFTPEQKQEDVKYGSTGDTVTNTIAYDRTFVLRQYKPIPATIVSDVRADAILDQDNNVQFPVRATVDRNVYSDNGRTVIIPTGTLLLGYVTGNVPGPYKSIGRMNVHWYQFILPNGVEFNFSGGNDPYSADSQGRIGVPGRGSTDYLEQFVMPMLTAIVPAAVNMIAPVADKFVNQIDLDNNTVVQSGTLRSSELAKNEIITAWNQVAQKLMVDMMDNNVPPFTIPAGTRITVYSPVDLQVSCGPDTGKKCSVAYGTDKRASWSHKASAAQDGSWVGQARSFSLDGYCTQDANGVWRVDPNQAKDITQNSGYSYSTVVGYCQSLNYKAINNVRQEAIYQNQQSADNKNSIASIGGGGSTSNLTQTYNENILGLKYNDEGTIQNPFVQESSEPTLTLTCEDGTAPDANGCCTGETYTDLDGEMACCPDSGGDCFPPII